jgi:hypothetical protein
MKLFKRPNAKIIGAYIGLADREGNLVSLRAPTLATEMALAKAAKGVGVYTNANGKQYQEDCLFIEEISQDDILIMLRNTNQECALIQDSYGDHYFLDQNGTRQFAGKMALLTSEPKSGDYSKFGEFYYQLV